MAERRPVKPRRHGFAFRAAAALTAIATLTMGAPAPVRAQDGGLPIIRDAEIEQLMRDYTQPILRAAGLAQQNVRVVLINDRSFNAFVIDGRRIFVNAGAITESQTPNQIIGVLAHETGHIAGGHLSKMRMELANAQTAALIATLLGVGAMVGASRSGGNVGGSPAAVALLAPQSVIMRSLLSYQRAHEEQADRAGVQVPGGDPPVRQGHVRNLQAVRRPDRVLGPLRRSRTCSRIRCPRSASPPWKRSPRPARTGTRRIRPSCSFATTSPAPSSTVSSSVPTRCCAAIPMTDQSLPARYARAISAYRHRAMSDAISQIDALIHAQPNNPYFHELKGQALLEAGRGREAVAPLRRAMALAPTPTLIQVMLGQALLASNDPAVVDEAVDSLKKALSRDNEIPDAHAQLAIAYGRKGNLAEADLASAQAAFNRGDFLTARQLATRAKGRFPVGTPGWVKSDDIASYRPPNPNQRRR